MSIADPISAKSSRRRFRIALCAFALGLGLIPFSSKANGRLETVFHINGGEAEAVDRELAQRFQSPYANRLIVAIKGLPDPDSVEGSNALGLIVDRLRAQPRVSGVLSGLDSPDPLFRGKGGGTLVIVGLAPGSGTEESLISPLRLQVADLQSRLKPQFPEINIQLTGETPLNFDFRKVSAEDVNLAEARVLPVTLILLLIAFGSVVAAMLPLSAGFLAISMTMGAAALLASHLHLSILVGNMATMLGLGLGIDYALLMVSRFREALANGNDANTSADIAARQAGRTLITSAATVAIGFAALLTVPISELSSIGVAGLLVVSMSVLICTCILPWVLGLLGVRVNSWRLHFPGRWQTSRDGILLVGPKARWRRWGYAVTGRPWTALLVAGLPLLVLAFQASRISPGLPPGNWLPAGAESVQGLRTLEGMGRSGIVQSLRVVLELPKTASPSTSTGWMALSRFTDYVAKDSRCSEAISLATLSGDAPDPEDLNLLPDETRRSFLRDDGLATLIEVLPIATLTPADQARWLRELRSSDVQKITGIAGAKIRIGGIAAINADYDAVVRKRLPGVIAGVVLGSFAAVALGLRSLFAAVKAILLNLLSVASSFGALVLVFQDGYGSGLLGLTGGTRSVFPIIPILSFAIVFGLSMDYEVFLVSRVLEERRKGLPEGAAVIEGMTSTAGLITSAASIMIAVFAAFMLGNFLVIKMLGFTLAVAVLIDATVVRMIIGPALLQIAGDWNWWPLGLHGSKLTTASDVPR
ncbi:MAG: MMPL family transporter [Terracidiphilus sp.]